VPRLNPKPPEKRRPGKTRNTDNPPKVLTDDKRPLKRFRDERREPSPILQDPEPFQS